VDPLLYWREALRRDPGDTRVNAVLGIVAFGQARYADAEKYLRKALERLTDRYTTPEMPRRSITSAPPSSRGNPDGAYPWFYKATGARPGRPPATIACTDRRLARGLRRGARFASRSIDSNALDLRAQNLRAAILRHLGRNQEALDVLASASHAADPLDVRAMARPTWPPGAKRLPSGWFPR